MSLFFNHCWPYITSESLQISCTTELFAINGLFTIHVVRKYFSKSWELLFPSVCVIGHVVCLVGWWVLVSVSPCSSLSCGGFGHIVHSSFRRRMWVRGVANKTLCFSRRALICLPSRLCREMCWREDLPPAGHSGLDRGPTFSWRRIINPNFVTVKLKELHKNICVSCQVRDDPSPIIKVKKNICAKTTELKQLFV